MDMIINLCFYIIQVLTISITYSECVFVILGTWNVKKGAQCYILICDISGYTIFSNISS